MTADLSRWTTSAWRRARARHGWLDHLSRAVVRYDSADGGRLSAAVTYYAFFATFAMALVGFAAFGFVLDDPAVQRSVQRYLAQNLPSLDIQAVRDARGTVGVIGFLGLPVTGWFWVDSLRSSIRTIWQLPQYPGRFVVRVLTDLLVLAGLGALLAGSLAAAFVTTALADRLVETAGVDQATARWLLAAVALVVSIAVNTLLSAAVLTGLPRLRMPLRRVVVPALLVAAGLELLTTVGRWYMRHVEANPTYQVVAGAVGLLAFLNVLNQLVLFAAALTATDPVGGATDLAVQRRPPRATSDRPHPAAGDHCGSLAPPRVSGEASHTISERQPDPTFVACPPPWPRWRRLRASHERGRPWSPTRSN